MLADIITIGDELLIGQVVDTNSAWIGQQLSGIGIRVRQKTTVSDDAQHITAALDQSKKRADLILITGGLGPTNDDITKKTLCEYFGMGWKMDDEVLEDVHKMFARFGKEVSAVNRLQAQIPDGCAVLRNRFGSAPGMWFEQDGKIFVSMPGVPHEMKVIMEECVIPTLRKRFSLPVIVHKNILVHGLGESILAEKIAAWEESLAKESLKLAYLPVPGLVRLRISGEGLDAKLLNEIVRVKVNELVKLIPKYVVGFDDDSLESVIGKLLTEKKKTVSTAESCTGGLIAHAITRIPGSSNYYMGSIIAYSYEVKAEQLGVTMELLEKFGAVSEECVKAMAEGVRKILKTDYAIAASGIAGPGGGTNEKPVGTTWIAVAAEGKTVVKEFRFGDNRERNIERTAKAGLNMLRLVMLGID